MFLLYILRQIQEEMQMFARNSGMIVRITLDIHSNEIATLHVYIYISIQGQIITDSTKCKVWWWTNRIEKMLRFSNNKKKFFYIGKSLNWDRCLNIIFSYKCGILHFLFFFFLPFSFQLINCIWVRCDDVEIKCSCIEQAGCQLK